MPAKNHAGSSAASITLIEYNTFDNLINNIYIMWPKLVTTRFLNWELENHLNVTLTLTSIKKTLMGEENHLETKTSCSN